MINHLSFKMAVFLSEYSIMLQRAVSFKWRWLEATMWLQQCEKCHVCWQKQEWIKLDLNSYVSSPQSVHQNISSKWNPHAQLWLPLNRETLTLNPALTTILEAQPLSNGKPTILFPNSESLRLKNGCKNNDGGVISNGLALLHFPLYPQRSSFVITRETKGNCHCYENV